MQHHAEWLPSSTEEGLWRARCSIQCCALWDIRGQAVSGPGWLTRMPLPLSSLHVLQLNFTYLQSIKDGYALLFHFGICLGLTWVHISLLLHSYHCCRVPLSFPAGYRQGPQPRNPFPTHLVDQNFINFPMKDA